MPIPFKKDPEEFKQRKLFAQNIFDLLPQDDDCFIYEDIYLRSHIEKVIYQYLDCGILHNGFARVRCGS
jgi:transposase